MTPEEMRSWGKHAHGSPLYQSLVDVVAADLDLMEIVSSIENTPKPNMLFAAVQYLLLAGDSKSTLANFYPSLGGSAGPDGVAGPFRDFVLANREEILGIGRTRYTQTNECRRCVALLPAIWATGATRFHLVDLGTSAGLNLAVDRYQYRWDDIAWGSDSGVVLGTSLRGETPRPREIEVLKRIGLDLNPLDATDPDERRWLEALIWPEHHERRHRLRAALDLTGDLDIELVPGNAVDTLQRALDGLPDGEQVLVMSSFALNQLTPSEREAIVSALDDAADRRPVHRVSFELLDMDEEWPTIRIGSGAEERAIGRAQPHGEWVELYALP